MKLFVENSIFLVKHFKQKFQHNNLPISNNNISTNIIHLIKKKLHIHFEITSNIF